MLSCFLNTPALFLAFINTITTIPFCKTFNILHVIPTSMSKSITITLPNATADSLDRHMDKLNENLPSGARISKSNYVAGSVKAALEKDGVVIVASDPAATET